MRRWMVLAAVVAAVTFGTAVPAAAEPGDLDGAFGTCGFAEPEYPIPHRSVGTGSKVVEVSVERLGPTSTLVIRRRTALGTLDPTFGTGGRTFADVPGWVNDSVDDVIVDRAGRVTVVVKVQDSGEWDVHAYVIRLTANGRLDASFGGGVVATGLMGVRGPSAAGDGTVTAVGYTYENAQTISTALRIGTNGVIIPMALSVPAPWSAVWLDALTVESAGSMLGIAREAEAGAGPWSVQRWLADGTLDPTFQPIGTPVIDGWTIAPHRVVPLDDGGMLVVFGAASDPEQVTTLVGRYSSDGSPDGSFGFGGVSPLPIHGPYRIDVATVTVDATGAITAVGAWPTDEGAERPRVVRLRPDGSPDPTFGIDGISALDTEEMVGAAATTRAVHINTLEPTPNGRWLRSLMSLDPLKAGAGLTLAWDGTAWPTRFGSDPGPECPYDTPYWEDADLARGITTVTGKGGYVVDAFGGTHRFSVGLQHPRPARAVAGPYWPGWDIVRGIAAKPDGTGGYVVDAFGAAHTFRTGSNVAPARIVGGPYWPGWDIVRGIALLPDGQRGYILDGYGGIHRFTTPGRGLPPALNHTAYWPGWDIARGISVLADGTGGYIVDAFGGAHPFGIGTHAPPPGPGPGAPYAAGEDWVRGFAFVAPMPSAGGAVDGSTTRPAEDAVRRTTAAADAAAHRRAPVGGPPAR